MTRPALPVCCCAVGGACCISWIAPLSCCGLDDGTCLPSVLPDVGTTVETLHTSRSARDLGR